MTKKIEAIIRPEKLNDVVETLRSIGIVGMNVIEIKGRGRYGGSPAGGADFLPWIQLNIILSDHNVERTVTAIRQASATGEAGDGIIFVYPVDDVIRIRTGERGREALMYADDIDVRRLEKGETPEVDSGAIVVGGE